MKVHEIRRVLKRHRAMRDIARDLGVSHTSVSLVLRGRVKSQRILDASRTRAQELIAMERQQDLVAAERRQERGN